MHSPDLYALRENFNRERIMLCFNGPISRSLIEEIGNALKNYLSADQALPAAATDVFAVYIEMTQNIRHYVARRGYPEAETAATVVISRDESGRYIVSAGNLVELGDGRAVMGRIEELAMLDKVALKAAYKEQLHKPRDPALPGGAGLGLLDIARKSSEPLHGALIEHGGERAFFSLRAVI
jgi:hypothetical protein